MSDLEDDATEYRSEGIDVEEELYIMSQAQVDFIYWSNMPFWSLDEGIALLLGKNPEKVNWSVIRDYVNFHFSSELCLNYSKLRKVVLRALEIQEIQKSNRPTIFLAWAEGRGIEIPKVLREEMIKIKENCKNCTTEIDELSLVTIKEKEIDVLKEELNLLQQRIVELKALAWEGFDEEKETYSKELAIAVKAHEAVSKNWKKGTSVKKQISLWLQENHPKLFNEEKERISKICNWQKSGGSPLTP